MQRIRTIFLAVTFFQLDAIEKLDHYAELSYALEHEREESRTSIFDLEEERERRKRNIKHWAARNRPQLIND